MTLLPLNMIFSYPPIVQIAYFSCCLLLALLGRNRKMGFWGHLFFSILFSPVLGLIVLLVSGKRRSKEKQEKIKGL